MLTEEGLRALTTETRSPHPPASAGTFSEWEKEGWEKLLLATHAAVQTLRCFQMGMNNRRCFLRERFQIRIIARLREAVEKLGVLLMVLEHHLNEVLIKSLSLRLLQLRQHAGMFFIELHFAR